MNKNTSKSNYLKLSSLMLAAFFVLAGCNLKTDQITTQTGSNPVMKKGSDESMMKKGSDESMMKKSDVQSYLPGQIQNYTASAYDAAIKDGKTVVIDFYASWCPTCNKNKPMLEEAVQEVNNKDLVVFTANFEKDTALKSKLGVTQQTTYVRLKDGKEVGRIGGLQSKEKFKNFLEA